MSDKSREKPGFSNYWTEDRIKKLKVLFDEGLSGTKISEALGDGITRNAVIGKLNRLGLKHNTREGMHKTISGDKPAKKKKVVTLESVKKDELANPKELIEIFDGGKEKIDPNKPITIMSLTEKTCRWPIGDPYEDDFHFCGKDSEDGAPYCKEHSEIAYQPIQNRRREQQTKPPVALPAKK